jgi:hypothetical protein
LQIAAELLPDRLLEALHTYDHDFNSFAEGGIIPHSFYDIKHHVGYIQLGNSQDTSEFACDSFRHWWCNQARLHCPSATSILVLCDGGGSNSSRHDLFKQDLQGLADELGIEIRIAHYPPYCSKYNPIEHRLFPHVTRAGQGVIFTSTELVEELMENTHTATGLEAFVHVIDKVYETGEKWRQISSKTCASSLLRFCQHGMIAPFLLLLRSAQVNKFLFLSRCRGRN